MLTNSLKISLESLLMFVTIYLITSLTAPASAQQKTEIFTGAKSVNKMYNALYVLNSGDEKHISSTLRNINNALEDPRLKGKLTIELVVFGDGVVAFNRTGSFLEQLSKLKAKGVRLAQCENTLRERKIPKTTLFDFIDFVPSGNGEIIIRSAEGWAIVHP